MRNGLKLDGVGPVDNRPFTDNIYQFVRKTKEKITKEKTFDM